MADGIERSTRFAQILLACSMRPSNDVAGRSQVAGGVYELSSDNGDLYRFEHRGSGNTLLLSFMSDRYGNQILLTHDADGKLQTVSTDGPDEDLQVRLSFTWETVTESGGIDVPIGKASAPWTTRSRIVAVADDSGRVWSYDYDQLFIDHEDRQVLVAVTETGLGDDARQQTVYTYEAPGGFRLASITRREVLPGAVVFMPTDTPAAVTSFKYYADGRLFQSIQPDGEKTTMLIHPWQGRRAIIDGRDQITRFALSTIGQTRRIETPLGDHLRYDWDADLQELRSEINAVGQRTLYTSYDAHGRLTGWTDTAGVSHALTYDPIWNQITNIDEASGRRWNRLPNGRSIRPTATSSASPIRCCKSKPIPIPWAVCQPVKPRRVVIRHPSAGDFTTLYFHDNRGQLRSDHPTRPRWLRTARRVLPACLMS
ncbi:MAG: hypothetical protein R3C05_14180 [Pirellulaceae bacterium]